MPYGYLGEQPNQKVINTGVFSSADAADLQSTGNWGGSLELIEENTISSNVTSVDFDLPAEYDVHALEIRGLEADGGGSFLVGLRVSTDGGSSFISSSDYQNSQEVFASAGTSSLVNGQSDNQINLGYSNDTEQNNTIAYIYDANNSGKYTWVSMMSMKQGFDMGIGGGIYDAVAAVNAIQVRGGTFDTGIIRLYGVKQL